MLTKGVLSKVEVQYPSLNIRLPVKEGFSYLAPIAVTIAGYDLDVHRDDPAFWLSLVCQEDKEKVEILEEQLQQGEIHRGPHRIHLKHKEGYLVGTELWLIPVYREESSLIAVEAIARDITRQEKIEKELVARNRELEVLNQIAYSDETAASITSFLSFSLEILLSVSEASEGGIYLLEENDIKLEVCSSGFDDCLGREIISRADLNAEEDFFSGAYGDPLRNWLVISIKEFHRCTGYCLLVSPLDRDLATAENKRLLKAALSGIGDALSRKRAEERLRFTEERYLGIVESIEDGYYELDQRGRFLFLNQAFSAMLGFPKNELMKKKLEDLCLNWEEFEKAGRTVFESGKGLKGITCTLKAKDRYFFVEVSLTPIMDRNGAVQGLRGFVRDITEKKNLRIR
ncbi:MAG: PAS domain S-box protein [Firmicutes bacterium]|nr:PAS domain S-box protein [Bacillota bacterium]